MADEKLIGRLDQSREVIQNKLIQLNRDIRAEFDDLLNNLPEPAAPQPPPAAAAPPADLGPLMAAVDQLHATVSQVDLLKGLVDQAGSLAPRVLLLIKKTGNLHGWAASGFSDDFINNRLKRIRWQVDQYAELQLVVKNRVVHNSNFNDLSDISSQIEAFDGFVPFKSLFVPLVVKNKVAAVVYADSGSEPGLGSADMVRLLCHVAGLELTLVAAKAKVAPSKPAAEPAAAPNPAPPSAPTPVAAPAQDAEPDSSFVGRMNDSPASATGFEMPQAKTFEPLPPEPEAPAPPPAAPPEEENPAIKKAKRAARVLVSDLMLYNEAAVNTAKANGDLYDRLKDDIDRSYQHYQERISDLKPPSERNFFKEEIIRQLAGGDPNMLGPFPF